MRSNFAALLKHHNREFRIDLLETDRCDRPAGPAPTITTSNSMLSRSISLINSSRIVFQRDTYTLIPAHSASISRHETISGCQTRDFVSDMIAISNTKFR